MNETRRDFVKMVGGVVAAAGVLITDARSAHAQQEYSTNDREFKAGERVPISALYDVIHDRIDGQAHAADHQLALKAGSRFPSCKVCQGWVKFRLHQAGADVTYF